jgi:hypothetical protein
LVGIGGEKNTYANVQEGSAGECCAEARGKGKGWVG